MGLSFDYFIVDAGRAWLVLAQRIPSQLGKTRLVVELRDLADGNT